VVCGFDRPVVVICSLVSPYGTKTLSWARGLISSGEAFTEELRHLPRVSQNITGFSVEASRSRIEDSCGHRTGHVLDALVPSELNSVNAGGGRQLGSVDAVGSV